MEEGSDGGRRREGWSTGRREKGVLEGGREEEGGPTSLLSPPSPPLLSCPGPCPRMPFILAHSLLQGKEEVGGGLGGGGRRE